MWFITDKSRKPKFYLPDGTLTEPPLDWTHEAFTRRGKVISSEPMVSNASQAIATLDASGVPGFKVKLDAKAFATERLPAGSWKYLRIRS